MTSTKYRQGLPEGSQLADDSISVVLAANHPSITVSSSGVQAQRIDEVSASVTYVGEAAVSAADGDSTWRIKKLETSGNVTSIKWAASGAYTQIWNDRASLTYS